MITSKKPTLLYILAASYSGSTLLTLLLAQHSKIATVGELIFDYNKQNIELYSCSCGELLQKCPFWKKVSAECAKRGVSFSVENFDTSFRGGDRVTNRLLRTTYKSPVFSSIRSRLIDILPGAAETLHRKVKRIFEIGQAIREVQKGSILLDSSKHPVRLHYFIESRLWDVKVIYLTRDGRGVTCSNMSNLGLNFKDAMEQWKRTAIEIHRFRSTLPRDSVIDIKYEDLCRNPAETLQGVVSKFDIPDFSSPSNRIRPGEHHILGNRMRLNFSSEIRLDERWKRALSEKQCEVFEMRYGTLNRILGYV